MSKKIHIRFYEELNDFLPKKKHKIRFEHTYHGKPSIKDIIESLGVPHTEIDLILVNGKSVGFNYYPENRDDISVYPVFEKIDIQELNHLRPKSLRETRFVLDVHLGKLARYLRLTGFDTLYNNSFEDREIVEISKDQKRIILTCDVGILKYNDVTHGLWIRERRPKEQLKEVIRRLDLISQIKAFTRCMECNQSLKTVPKAEVVHLLEEKTRKYYDEFYKCENCNQVFWEGSHFLKMKDWLKELD